MNDMSVPRKHNPTPVQKMREEGRRKGLSEFEIVEAIQKRWPDQRTVDFNIYNQEQRKVFTRFAKYLIDQGIAVDYQYRSKQEMRQYIPEQDLRAGVKPKARGTIQVVGRDTPLPWDKLEVFSEEFGVYMDAYDDEYSGPYENPGTLKNRLLR